jgi:hypothetical protein
MQLTPQNIFGRGGSNSLQKRNAVTEAIKHLKILYLKKFVNYTSKTYFPKLFIYSEILVIFKDWMRFPLVIFRWLEFHALNNSAGTFLFLETTYRYLSNDIMDYIPYHASFLYQL